MPTNMRIAFLLVSEVVATTCAFVSTNKPNRWDKRLSFLSPSLLPPSLHSRSSLLVLQDDTGSEPSLVEKGRDDVSDGSTETLVFLSDYSTASAPLGSATRKEVVEFLESPENRRLFFAVGGKRTVEEFVVNDEFNTLWTNMCDEYYGDDYLPTATDTIIKTTSDVKFPGMTLYTISCSGVKVRTSVELDDGTKTGPLYEYVQIAEKLEPVGLRPAVWIFNKLTGNAKKEKGVFLPPEGKATAVLSVHEDADGVCAFSFRFTIQRNVVFPRTLMRILPTSKEKMQEQGSSSILKAVVADVEKSLQHAADKFMEGRIKDQ